MSTIEKTVGKSILLVEFPVNNNPKSQAMEVSIGTKGQPLRSTWFNNFGDTDWRVFLCSFDEGYIGGRFFSATRENCLKQTNANTRLHVAQGYWSGDYTKDQVVEVKRILRDAKDRFEAEAYGHRGNERQQIEDATVMFVARSCQNALQQDDPGGLIGSRRSKGFKEFLSKTWYPVMESLREELAQEAAAERASTPRNEAVAEEHEADFAPSP